MPMMSLISVSVFAAGQVGYCPPPRVILVCPPPIVWVECPPMTITPTPQPEKKVELKPVIPAEKKPEPKLDIPAEKKPEIKPEIKPVENKIQVTPNLLPSIATPPETPKPKDEKKPAPRIEIELPALPPANQSPATPETLIQLPAGIPNIPPVNPAILPTGAAEPAKKSTSNYRSGVREVAFADDKMGFLEMTIFNLKSVPETITIGKSSITLPGRSKQKIKVDPKNQTWSRAGEDSKPFTIESGSVELYLND